MMIRKIHSLGSVMNITSREKVKCLVQGLTHGRHPTRGTECPLLEGKIYGAASMAADQLYPGAEKQGSAGTSKHLVNERRPPPLRKACDEFTCLTSQQSKNFLLY